MVTAESPLRSEPGYVFDFSGGQLAIDFTNTVGSRGGVPEEHLRTVGDVIAWAEARGILSRGDGQRLRRDAGRRPEAARQALAAALRLREALYRVLRTSGAQRQAPAADLAILNAHVRDIFSRARLEARHSRLTLTMDQGDPKSMADPILAPVVRAAVDLLTSDAIARVRTCADDSCAWLFLDQTRNRTRRWCDMKVCGNRNKVRRFRSTKQAPYTGPHRAP